MNEFDRMLIEKMREAISDKVEAMGYDLLDVELFSGPKGRTVRVFIDKPGGVTIDDCADVSYLIDKDIENIMVLEGSYFLEVSSPGLTRQLKGEKDFVREQGKLCKVVLLDGKVLKGTIGPVLEGKLLLRTENGDVYISLEDIKKANLEYEVK